MNKHLNTICLRGLLLGTLLWIGLASCATAAGLNFKTEANVMVELKLTASRAYGDPFNQVTLDVVFIDPHRRELRVPAFWDGGKLWKVRYASPVIGTHHFRSECSEPRDSGLHAIQGKVEVTRYIGRNPLFQHGPVKVAAAG